MTIADLKSARLKLKTNSVQMDLPGRKDKIEELENFLVERLKIRKTTAEKKARVECGQVANIRDKHMNKTVFVCGVPGTGKTAVVMKVVDQLQRQLKTKGCPLTKFQSVYINAQHLAAPQRVYSQILYEITKMNQTPEKAQETLEIIFNSEDPEEELKPSRKAKGGVKRKPVAKDHRYIIIIDELDLLYSEKKQTVFYNLFDWPTSHLSRMILITIANAMDLAERYMRGRIGSRLGWNKIIFEPYASEHLEGILVAKLGKDLMNKCFDQNAIRIASKRIGKTTGDARRIIDTCCLAVDEAIQEKVTKVTSAIVDRVGFQNLDRMKTDYVKGCPPLELMTLRAILNESANQGEENIVVDGVLKQVEHALRTSKDPWLKDRIIGPNEFNLLLNTLQAVGLIVLDDQKNIMHKRLFIKDTSDAFRDVIRNTEPIVEKVDRSRKWAWSKSGLRS